VTVFTCVKECSGRKAIIPAKRMTYNLNLKELAIFQNINLIGSCRGSSNSAKMFINHVK
jgi:hypothetical protein